MVAHRARAVIVISGRGSNMRSLVAAQDAYEVIGVASNSTVAEGLEFARMAGIEIIVHAPESENPRLKVAAQKDRLWQDISARRPDYVLLAGYMQIVPPHWIAAFERRILNIHPALLPALPGLNTHARALAEGRTRHGASVHLVDAGVDTGDVIAQMALDIAPDETEQTLAARVLKLEHVLYPWVVNQIARSSILLSPTVQTAAQCLSAAQRLGITLES